MSVDIYPPQQSLAEKTDSRSNKLESSWSFSLNYEPALDGMRAYAIILVMIFHAQIGILEGGGIGVDLFFVLSGFLITILLLQENRKQGSISLKKFYFRRAIRLFPAMLALVTLYLIYIRILESTWAFSDIYPVVFYYSNWMYDSHIGREGAFDHSWSLSIEEQFYLICPVLLFGLLKFQVKIKTIKKLLVLAIGLLCFHRMNLALNGAPFERLYNGLDTRGDELLMGCLLATLLHDSNKFSFNHFTKFCSYCVIPALLVILIATQFTSWNDDYYYLGGFTLTAFCSAILIGWIVTSESNMKTVFFEQKALIWIGQISYGLYLWHYPAFRFVENRFSFFSEPMVFLLKILITLMIASTSYYMLERPILKLKKDSKSSQ